MSIWNVTDDIRKIPHESEIDSWRDRKRDKGEEEGKRERKRKRGEEGAEGEKGENGEEGEEGRVSKFLKLIILLSRYPTRLHARFRDTQESEQLNAYSHVLGMMLRFSRIFMTLLYLTRISLY